MAELDLKVVSQGLKLKTKENLLVLKRNTEANVVSILYKKPELYYETELSIDDFDENVWKVYFEIGKRIIIDEQKKTLDNMTVGFYLEKHDKLKQVYVDNGGFEMIETTKKYVNEDNFIGYEKELMKWKTIIKLNEWFPVSEAISDYNDLSLDDIYNLYEARLNNIFINSDSNEYESHDIKDDLYGLIDRLNNGVENGLPYKNMPILTNEVAGMRLGEITLIGGLSNVGKSMFLRNGLIPSCIENNERLVVMLNEENYDKWQRELLVYVANNMLNKELKKITVRNGNFSVDNLNILIEAADYINKMIEDHLITIVTFKKYRTSRVLKVIKTYSAMGVKYFALDTFKLGDDAKNRISHEAMAQDMVEIMDLIKPSNKNVNIEITFQLAKSSTRQRYYMQDNIGVSKAIVDPASCCLMIRKVFEDEYPGGAKELDIRDSNGDKVFLDEKKNYQVLFIVKNREGSAGTYQVVIEHDMSRNILKEVGITHVPIDF